MSKIAATTLFPVPQNCSEFIEKSAEIIGRFHADNTNQFIKDQCRYIESPIEQLFISAFCTVAEINCIEYGVTCGTFGHPPTCLQIIHQWNQGKYRIDFALRSGAEGKIVCVELDGHKFHDRDEPQRRYEKIRDRFLIASGFSVIHFTGAEIVKDPYAAALEAINLAVDSFAWAVHPTKEDAQ